jgi:hypothetical protein
VVGGWWQLRGSGVERVCDGGLKRMRALGVMGSRCKCRQFVKVRPMMAEVYSSPLDRKS